MTDPKPPKVFISYAWEDNLKTWVLDFATRLRSDGINAILDQWETRPGDQLPEFMEKSVRESDFVVFVCTPAYKRKSDRRKGGVGYEGHIITGEIFSKNNHGKFIPVLRKSKWNTASPTWATSKQFIDFRGEPYSETSYKQLLDTILGNSPVAPPVRNDSKEEIAFKVSEEIAKKGFEPEHVGDEVIAKPVKKYSTPRRKLTVRRWFAILAQISLAILVVLTFILTVWKPSFPTSGLLSDSQVNDLTSPVVEFTESASVTPPLTSIVPQTFFPSETLSVIPTQIGVATSNFSPIEITDAKGVLMMLVPAGTFIMGSDSGDGDEKPPHDVFLESFYMDKYEVTNKLYKECVDSGGCVGPWQTGSSTRQVYFGNPQFDNFPVIYVDWNMAKAFCQWRGVRLPTEAEWEKAARGTDGRTFPWGEDIDETFANYDEVVGNTTAVGSYEKGKSPYGIYDMAGNVWEWVAEWYDVYPGGDPKESKSFGDTYRVYRGGSWSEYWKDLRVSKREHFFPASWLRDQGFRCAKDANP